MPDVLPPGLRLTMLSRLQTITPDAIEVLKFASVLGRPLRGDVVRLLCRSDSCIGSTTAQGGE